MTKQVAQALRASGARWSAGLVLLVGTFASSAALGVSLSVVSPPPVRQRGDTASVCVELDSAGDTVVGVENELFWSSACASIVGDCTGDNVRAAPLRNPGPGNDGVKVIVLDMGGLSPIPDGILYCCSLRVHPESGSCCPISIRNAGSSDPKGNRLSTVGRPGQVCVASAPAAGGRLETRPRPREQAPVLGADLGPPAPEPMGEAPPRAGGPVGAAPRPPAVMPGAEPLAQVPPVEQPVEEPIPTPEQEPTAGTEAEEPEVRPTPVPTAARTPAPAATTAPMTAPTRAAPTVAPRSPVMPPRRAAETKRAVEATPEKRSGCQCQIGATGDGGSGLAFVLGTAALLWARRRGR